MRLRFVRLEPDELVREATYSGDAGDAAPSHPPEPVRALPGDRGAMRVIVGDEDRVYRPDETFEVPAGTPHQMGTGEPTTMRWKVRRALRTAQFFERLGS